MNIIKIVTDKAFWVNILILIVVLLISTYLIFYSLKVITRYGKSTDVPNVLNISLDKAISKIENVGLLYEIKDSVYNIKLKENTVLEVSPNVGLNVKLGRKLYLVVSTKRPPMVVLPNIVGRSSYRFAKIELEARGLIIDKVSYVPSLEKDAVLSLKIGNNEIASGTKIPKGTKINLVLGDGGNKDVILNVPYLIGKTQEEASQILSKLGIEGNYYFNNDIQDSANAVIFKQYPFGDGEEKLNLAEPIDLFLSKTLPKNILEDSTFKARNGLN